MKTKFPIVIFIFLVTFISVSCGRGAPPPKEDFEPPIIMSTIPDNQSLDNSINTAITVVFNEIIDPASVTSGTISVRDAMTGALVEEDITCADSIIILTARSPLQPSTVYAVNITGVRDISGNAMLNPMTFTFTTLEGDSTSPDILQTNPERGAVNIGVNTTIGVKFTEDMLASTISATLSPFTLTTGTTNVAGSIISFDGRTAIFAPAKPLDYSTTYTAMISDSVTDLAGNHPLWGNPYTWEFTTQMLSQDNVPPTVVSTTPANLATNVSVYAPVVAIFDEIMLESSITSSTFLLTEKQSGELVPGQVSVISGNTAIFIAVNSLKYATDYLVTLGTNTEGIRDNSGNPLVPNSPQGYTWNFKTEPPILTVTKGGTGSGIVSVSPGTLTWTDNVGTATYTDYGTPVTLNAAASAGSMFAGWSGEGCTGMGACTVTMTTARNVTATFTLSSTYSLTVTKTGTGSGSVSASPGTLAWNGNTGTAAYAVPGTEVTLTATAGSGSTFTGWSGEGCSGTGICKVIMTAARNVTANFMYDSYLLTVTKTGTGDGIVSVSTGTLTWTDKIGTATYTEYNKSVTLTAAASEGSTFAGWSGEGCTGTGTCTVNMTAARNVTATFTIYTFKLTVTKAGKGSGDVIVDTSTLKWAADKGTATYNWNTLVTATAIAGSGSTFTGWSGEGCTGTGTCEVTMIQARSITATFDKLAAP
jgi:hypothetical protein